ncbi:MAG: acyl-CoA thioesterase [Actinomycetota bacterium]
MTSSAKAVPATTVLELLDLEQLDRDLYRGVHSLMEPGRPALYGGQVAAQALMAAGLTVPDGRMPHSLHGYFLRPGRPDVPVNFQVHRDRDGRSFSARHVAAVQDGEVIFSMLASFHAGADGAEIDLVDATPMPPPEECEPWPSRMPIDMVQVTKHEYTDAQKYSDTFWVRAAHPLPDDPLVHACGITFMSDIGTGFGQIQNDEVGYGGPSIDHAMWFQAAIPADEWVLVHLWAAKAFSRRATYHGAMRDRSGRLGAMITQEHLLVAKPAMDMRTWPEDWKEQMQ